ncbi:hypothetical protein [Arhodomonas aquaeolei]|uniref:hypothetical protein n=1 Tax=Arhodomonas aquaeolei TaxID=2369 RepID=UPI00036E8582|nr:hypothetical protein [Arhodomonas aquaeolei]
MDSDAYFWAGMAGGRHNQIKRQNRALAEQGNAINELHACYRELGRLRDAIVHAAEERGIPQSEIMADKNVQKQREAVVHAEKSAQSLYEIGRGFRDVEPYPHPNRVVQKNRERRQYYAETGKKTPWQIMNGIFALVILGLLIGVPIMAIFFPPQ